MKLFRFLLLSLPLLLLATCTKPHTIAALNTVETIIDERPDSALVILNRLKERQMLPSKKAKFSLFHAMALDKNDIDTSDVEIVMPAVRYYRLTGNDARLMKAWYYLGCIQINGGEKENALVSWLKAEKLAEHSDDDYFKGLLYSRLGRAFNDSYNNIEALHYHQKAYKAFVAAGKTLYARGAQFSVAQEFNNIYQFEKADSLYRQVYDGNDDIYAWLALMGASHTMIVKPNPDYKKAVELYRKADSIMPGKASEDEVWEHAIALEKTGDETLSNQLLAEPDQGNFQVHWCKYEIYKNRHDYKNALTFFEKHVFDGQDSIVLAQLKQSYLRVQRDYYQSESILEQKKATEYKYMVLLIVLCFIFTLILAVASWKSYKNKKEQEFSQIIAASDEANRLLAESLSYSGTLKSTIARLRESYFTVYKKQFEALGKLFEPANKASDDQMAARLSNETVAKYKAIIAEIRGKEASQKQLEELINKETDGLISRLRADYPEIKDRDILLACYMALGFDSTTISCITGETQNNVRVRRHRLKHTIANRSTQNSELYFTAIE